jgi:hypothetical protein
MAPFAAVNGPYRPKRGQHQREGEIDEGGFHFDPASGYATPQLGPIRTPIALVITGRRLGLALDHQFPSGAGLSRRAAGA